MAAISVGRERGVYHALSDLSQLLSDPDSYAPQAALESPQAQQLLDWLEQQDRALALALVDWLHCTDWDIPGRWACSARLASNMTGGSVPLRRQRQCRHRLASRSREIVPAP